MCVKAMCLQYNTCTGDRESDKSRQYRRLASPVSACERCSCQSHAHTRTLWTDIHPDHCSRCLLPPPSSLCLRRRLLSLSFAAATATATAAISPASVHAHGFRDQGLRCRSAQQPSLWRWMQRRQVCGSKREESDVRTAFTACNRSSHSVISSLLFPPSCLLSSFSSLPP